MRPKKKVLLVSADEDATILRRFMLQTRGFKVVCASFVEMALSAASVELIDVAVVDLQCGEEKGNDIVLALKNAHPELPTIMVSATVKCGEIVHHADAFLGKQYCTPMELLERVRQMSRRKRGPHKQPKPVCGVNMMVACAWEERRAWLSRKCCRRWSAWVAGCLSWRSDVE